MPIDVAEFYPYRSEGKIYVRINGEETELHPMEAKIIAERWFDVIAGAYVYSQVNND